MISYSCITECCPCAVRQRMKGFWPNVGVSRALAPSHQRCENLGPGNNSTQWFSSWVAPVSHLRSFAGQGGRVGEGGSKKAKPTESESFKGKCYVLKAPQEFGGATRIKNPLRTLLSVTPLLSSEGNTLRLHGALYIKKHSDRSYYPTLILELCTDAWFSQRNGALIWGVLGL